MSKRRRDSDDDSDKRKKKKKKKAKKEHKKEHKHKKSKKSKRHPRDDDDSVDAGKATDLVHGSHTRSARRPPHETDKAKRVRAPARVRPKYPTVSSSRFARPQIFPRAHARQRRDARDPDVPHLEHHRSPSPRSVRRSTRARADETLSALLRARRESDSASLTFASRGAGACSATRRSSWAFARVAAASRVSSPVTILSCSTL